MHKKLKMVSKADESKLKLNKVELFKNHVSSAQWQKASLSYPQLKSV